MNDSDEEDSSLSFDESETSFVTFAQRRLPYDRKESELMQQASELRAAICDKEKGYVNNNSTSNTTMTKKATAARLSSLTAFDMNDATIDESETSFDSLPSQNALQSLPVPSTAPLWQSPFRPMDDSDEEDSSLSFDESKTSVVSLLLQNAQAPLSQRPCRPMDDSDKEDSYLSFDESETSFDSLPSQNPLQSLPVPSTAPVSRPPCRLMDYSDEEVSSLSCDESETSVVSLPSQNAQAPLSQRPCRPMNDSDEEDSALSCDESETSFVSFPSLNAQQSFPVPSTAPLSQRPCKEPSHDRLWDENDFKLLIDCVIGTLKENRTHEIVFGKVHEVFSDGTTTRDYELGQVSMILLHLFACCATIRFHYQWLFADKRSFLSSARESLELNVHA
jgi:hypothetical protein